MTRATLWRLVRTGTDRYDRAELYWWKRQRQGGTQLGERADMRLLEIFDHDADAAGIIE
ncbi:hypothetical protein [uncultured Sphingomonas sp.]|uniref:hypothetical protein n=1 Tax=uncultured Sphingomonas sp. TaxID=158754 RepID=UPI00262CC884|nr:hypothetical protein [uncultured Sphingomonas sp.]